MTPYQAMRDARLIELDILTLIETKYPEDWNFEPLLRKISDRVGRLADALNDLDQVGKEQLRAAERWKLVHETLGITHNENKIFRAVHGGQQLVATGKTLTEAADKALGFK